VDDIEDRFIATIAELQEVADAITAEDAAGTFGETTLQNFWRDWTGISQWAGSLWRLLNQDLGDAASPSGPGSPETGGSG
jgi:hypothetical protein